MRMDEPLRFLISHWPNVRQVTIGLPLAFAWNGACLNVAGRLQTIPHCPTRYSRNLFHFAIFFSAVLIRSLGGLSSLFVFGGGVSLVVVYAVLRGPGHRWYEALVREQDRPHRTLLIIFPYLATLATVHFFFAGVMEV